MILENKISSYKQPDLTNSNESVKQKDDDILKMQSLLQQQNNFQQNFI